MQLIDQYRASAVEQRKLALEASLPRICEQHLRAADRWDFLADEAEGLQVSLAAMFEKNRRSTPDMVGA